MAKTATVTKLADRRPNSIVRKLADVKGWRGYHACGHAGCANAARPNRKFCPVHAPSASDVGAMVEYWTARKVARKTSERDRAHRSPNRAERSARKVGDRVAVELQSTRDVRALADIVTALAATVEKLAAR